MAAMHGRPLLLLVSLALAGGTSPSAQTQTPPAAQSQPPLRPPSRADILRGEYGRHRANNDLLHYGLEIRVDPVNEASLTIPRKLGFVEEGILRRRLPPDEDGVPRDVVVFSLFRDGLAGSPASSAPVRAFDAGGERVL